jgi:hypothetical protein
MSNEHHTDATARNVRDGFLDEVRIFGKAMAERMRHGNNAKGRKDQEAWRKANALTLLTSCLRSIQKFQTTGHPTDLVDAGNYLMMLYNLEPEQRAVIRDSPKIVTFMAPPQSITAFVRVLKKQAMELRLSNVEPDPAKAKNLGENLHAFFLAMDTGIGPLAEMMEEGVTLDPTSVSLVQGGTEGGEPPATAGNAGGTPPPSLTAGPPSPQPAPSITRGRGKNN